MKAPFSEYLNTLAPSLKQLVSKLGEDYDYVSVLSTDSKGFAIRISQQVKVISSSNLTTERGSVVRVYKDGLYKIIKVAEKMGYIANMHLITLMRILSRKLTTRLKRNSMRNLQY